MEKPIHIDQVRAKLNRDVERFVEYYKEGISNTPEQFPTEFYEEDWIEQFLSFLSFDVE